MGICAYCKEDRKLTREHLIPAWMYRARPEWTMKYLGRVDGLVEDNPVIKDVCERCNNGVLSNLDTYLKALWDKHLSVFVRQGQSIEFEYDYDPLAKWLLKVSFNNSRVKSDNDCAALSSTTPYILGEGSRPKSLTLFLRLIIPHRLTDAEVKEWNVPQSGLLDGGIPPNLVRIDNCASSPGIPELSVCRRVIVQSYEFWALLAGQPNAEIEMSRENEAARPFVTKDGAVPLYRSRDTATVPASNTTYLDIMKSFVAKHPNL